MYKRCFRLGYGIHDEIQTIMQTKDQTLRWKRRMVGQTLWAGMVTFFTVVRLR